MNILTKNIPLIVVAALTLATVTSVQPIAHAEEGSRWQVKTSVVLVDTNDPFTIDKPSGGQVQAGGNAEIGAAIAVEYRLSDLIGLEVGTVFAKSPDVDDTTDSNNNEIGEGPSFVPLIVGANFYLSQSEKLDVYVGPRIAYVRFGDFDLDLDGQNTKFEVDNEFGWGATAGINYKFGESRWELVAEATYLDVDMNIKQRGTDNTVNNGFDPLMVNLGVSYRF